MDVLTAAQRRLNMSRIRSTNSKPEIVLRRGLHATGLRFRLHVRSLPGTPDIVFPKHKVVLQVNGCFWHGHRCALFKLPETRQQFWAAKIAANEARDVRVTQALRDLGWRVLVIWECALKGPERLPFAEVVARARAFVTSRSGDETIAGTTDALTAPHTALAAERRTAPKLSMTESSHADPAPAHGQRTREQSR